MIAWNFAGVDLVIVAENAQPASLSRTSLMPIDSSLAPHELGIFRRRIRLPNYVREGLGSHPRQRLNHRQKHWLRMEGSLEIDMLLLPISVYQDH
jgi:hypothetical protein